jgi:hypothetical protein
MQEVICPLSFEKSIETAYKLLGVETIIALPPLRNIKNKKLGWIKLFV